MINVAEILRAVSWTSAVGWFKATGGDLDGWSKRGNRERMANALARAEDELELIGPSKTARRSKVREVRRRLELELWP